MEEEIKRKLDSLREVYEIDETFERMYSDTYFRLQQAKSEGDAKRAMYLGDYMAHMIKNCPKKQSSYLDKDCENCGRHRVELVGEKQICEKCNWNQEAHEYEPSSQQPEAPNWLIESL